MFCIVAFMVLAVSGIFSARNRELAREAWSCVFRRVTFRPCTTGFDVKMKSRILGSVINRSETAARLLNKNFELLSWTMFLVMTVSFLFAVRGSYLFYVTGNCNGLNESSFCLFDPKGENSKLSSVANGCSDKPASVSDLTLQPVNLSVFPTMKRGGKHRVVMIGCYGCSYTRKVYRTVKEIAANNDATFVFMDYPVKVKSNLMTRLGWCVYQRDPAKYWQLNDKLFGAAAASLDDAAFAKKMTAELGLDWAELSRCLDDAETDNAILGQMDEIAKTRFFGTPTVFIDGKAFVGPKPYRVYAIAMKGLLYWLR